MDFKLSSAAEICFELSRRLKAQRLAKNIKQQELAVRAGVSVGTVKNLETHGQASLETWIRIIMALDLIHDLERLFTLKLQSIAEMERLEQLKTKILRRRAR